ncbi:hypothetical protein L6164_032467 [Bauhinia variegata]|nr:hypothetical protein L6164_032467 [Bauhinia variegata]
MICAACNCHRNFHKREVRNLPVSSPNPVNAVAPAPAPAAARAPPVRPSVPSTNNNGGPETVAAEMRHRKTRIRFTPEQKAQLMNFAVRIGWRTRHTPETLIENFCREMGITRRVLRDWLSNNRHLRHTTSAVAADGAGTA